MKSETSYNKTETNLGRPSINFTNLLLKFAGIGPLFVLLCIVISIINPAFLTVQNWINLLTASAGIWIMAMAMTMVLLTAGFDLSVGSVMALSGVTLLSLLTAGIPELLSILLTLVIITALGFIINGLLIGKVGLNFFVITLGTLSLYRGVVYVWTNGETKYVSDYPLIMAIGNGKLAGIPFPIILMFLIFVLSYFILKYTNFGRSIYIVGGNPQTARVSGINVTLIITIVYAISALFAGIAGIVETARMASAAPTIGVSTELLVAAAVLLGGTSFKGGVGTVTGTALGVLFIAVLQNGLSLANVSSYWQNVLTGLVLIIAIYLNHIKSKRV
jgi:ribose transport system permease protein